MGPGSGCVRGRHEVGIARGEELLDRFDEGRDALDSSEILVGRQDGEGGHVLPEEVDLPGRQLLPSDAVPLGTLEERVVDVGDVLDVAHGDPAVAQGANE